MLHALKQLKSTLADELLKLGAKTVKPTRAGCYFTGRLQIAYTVIIWSRLASRVSFIISQIEAKDQALLYENIKDQIPWHEHIPKHCKLVVQFNGQNKNISNNYIWCSTRKRCNYR